VTIRVQIKGAIAKITDGSTKLVSKFLSVKNPKYFWEVRSNPNAQEWINFVDPVQKTFPAGLVPQLVKAARKRNISVDYNDTSGDHVKVDPKCLNGVVARDYQVIAAQHGLKHQRCVLECATGSGKTTLCGIICFYRRDAGSILVVVPSKHLLYQTADALSSMLGEPVGRIGDGKLELNNRITVGIPASLAKGVQGDPKWSRKYNRMMKAPAADSKTADFLKTITTVIIDEAHHSSADSWTRMLLSVPAAVRIGMSGTADKRGSLDYWRLMAVTGPVVYRITSQELIERGFLSRPKIAFITDDKVFGPPVSSYRKSKTNAPNPHVDMLPWNVIYSEAIVNNKHYNSAVAQFARSLVQRKHPSVILCTQTTHIRNIQIECKRIGLKTTVIEGKIPVATRMKYLDNLVKNPDHVLLGSNCLDEGIDVPDIEAIILAGGGTSLVKLIQRIGRVLRKKSNGRNKAIVVDFGHSHNQHTAKHAIERVEECDRQGWEIVNVEDVSNFAKITRMA
jgi:superfamily II DNA or RNA helicase